MPVKADAEKQRAFLKCYEALKVNKAPEDPIYFMDATHPVAGYGWLKRDQDREIRIHTGRQCLNINSAINFVSYIQTTT